MPLQPRQAEVVSGRGDFATLARYVAVGLPALVALTAGALSVLPLPWLTELTAREFADGRPNLLLPHQVAKVRFVLMAVAGIAAVCGLAAATFLREWVESTLEMMFAEARHSWRSLREDTSGLTGGQRWSILGAIACGGVLRMVLMGGVLQFDEATTGAFFASSTLFDAVTDYLVPNNHVLYSLIANVSQTLFGDGVFALRLPALAAGVALIPAAAWVALRVTDGNAAGPSAGLCAWLVALWPGLAAYGALARGYSLATLLCVCALAVATLRPAISNCFQLTATAVLLALAAWAVPAALVAAAAVGIWMVLDTGAGPMARRLRRVAALALVTLALVLVLYAPIWLVQGFEPLLGNAYVTPSQGQTYLEELQRETSYLLALSGMSRLAFAAVFSGLGLWALLAARQGQTASLRLIVAAVAGIVVLALLTRRALPARVIAIQLPMVLAAMAALVTTGRGRWRLGAAAITVALIAWVAGNALQPSPGLANPVTNDTQAPIGLHDAVIASSPFMEAGRPLVVDAWEGMTDPTRYYVRVERGPGMRIDVLHAFGDFDRYSRGVRFVTLRRLDVRGPSASQLAALVEALDSDSGWLSTLEATVIGDVELRLVEVVGPRPT